MLSILQAEPKPYANNLLKHDMQRRQDHHIDRFVETKETQPTQLTPSQSLVEPKTKARSLLFRSFTHQRWQYFTLSFLAPKYGKPDESFYAVAMRFLLTHSTIPVAFITPEWRATSWK